MVGGRKVIALGKANEDFYFYGNGIQIENIGAEFARLKNEMDRYNAEKQEKKGGLLGMFANKGQALPRRQQNLLGMTLQMQG